MYVCLTKRIVDCLSKEVNYVITNRGGVDPSAASSSNAAAAAAAKNSSSERDDATAAKKAKYNTCVYFMPRFLFLFSC